MSSFCELVYANDACRKVIEERFPEAQITDASDFIHEERFQVERVDRDEFYAFAEDEGFAPLCLGWRLRRTVFGAPPTDPSDDGDES